MTFFEMQDRGSRLRRAGLLAGFILMTCCGAFAAAHVDLDGFWQFKTDPGRQGESARWTQKMPTGTETDRVPGTWSVIPKYFDYVGDAWYFKTFTLPANFRKLHVEVHFGATFYKSQVWLNGARLGAHEGGYTAYYFDATPYLHRTNYLAVEIDDQPGVDTIPGWAMRDSPRPGRWYDWWPDGGIVRDVWLRVSPPELVRRQQIRSRTEGASAIISDRVYLENHSAQARAVKLVVKVWAPDGSQAAASVRTMPLPPGTASVRMRMTVRPVQRWSFDNPNLYRLEADLMDSRGSTMDSRTDNFGVRTIEIRNRKLYLNGQAVRLTGIDRHEDSPWEGLAETEGTIRHDYDDLKNLQVTLTRPVHYPQNPGIYDFCDRHGILLIPEIPLWHFSASQFADPKVIELAKQMMREVIEQDGNHPSIFAWSVCNESATNTPQGVAYFKTMYRFIKSLDPERDVTYADDQLPLIKDPRQNAASYADFVMWNEYYGSGHGPASALPGLIEKVGNDYSNKMVIISETAPWMALTRDSGQAQKFRNASIGRQLALMGKYPWIAGVLYWCYQPYRTHAHVRRTRLKVPVPAPSGGIGSFGFVDQNRQRQPIYDAFRRYNSPAVIQVRLRWPRGSPAISPPGGFAATIRRRDADQIPSYPLEHYQAVWQLVDAAGAEVAAGQQKLPEIGVPFRLEASWQAPAKPRTLTLHLWLYRPTGFLAAKRTCWWRPPIWRMSIWRCGGQ